MVGVHGHIYGTITVKVSKCQAHTDSSIAESTAEMFLFDVDKQHGRHSLSRIICIPFTYDYGAHRIRGNETRPQSTECVQRNLHCGFSATTLFITVERDVASSELVL